MQLHEQISYDADVPAVFAMLCDRQFRADVCAALYALRHTVVINTDGQGAVVTIERVMPADVPPALKTVVGDHITIAQTEVWSAADPSGRRTADVTIRLPGRPARMSGMIVLRPQDGGCLQTFSGDIRVSVPLVGAKIEAAIADAIRFAIAKEADLGRRHLATSP